MPPRKTDLSRIGLARLIFRRWPLGLLVGAVSAGGAFAFLARSPHRYVSEILIERRAPRLTANDPANEFDMTRLTSEIQRTVTLLKSSFMMDRWMDALGEQPKNLAEREKIRATLLSSLTVKPVNFTTIFSIRTAGISPEQARQRVSTLVQVFSTMVVERQQAEASRVIEGLSKRLDRIEGSMKKTRTTMKRSDIKNPLDLAGSTAQREEESHLDSDERLRSQLVREINETTPSLHLNMDEVVRILADPVVSRAPLSIPARQRVVAVGVGLFCALASLLLLDWTNPLIWRAGDVFPFAGEASIIPFPKVRRPEKDLEGFAPLLDPVGRDLSEALRLHGKAVVQMVSASDGEGKTTLANLLAHLLKDTETAYRTEWTVGSKKTLSTKGEGSPPGEVSSPLSVEDPLPTLLKTHRLVIVDTNVTAPALPWNSLLKEPDVLCVVLSAGRTRRAWLQAFASHLNVGPSTKIHFILNYYTDPLPPLWRP
jgi:hypothetical protein